MTLIRTAWNEFIGLFVDDGALALFAILLVAIIAVAVKLFGLSALIGGCILLIGCLVVLAFSLVRATSGR